jgi:YidC/Oxa1 family membrane protein insertase
MLGTLWNNILFYPFLNLLMVSYHFLGDNLGWGVILLAILVRLLLIPSVKKQLSMTTKMAELKPRLDKLQEKYAANKEKLAQEQMKLYKDVGYNPLGCIGSFVPQMLILYVIIQVIRVVTVNDFTGLYPSVQDLVFAGGDQFINTNFFMVDLAKNYSEIASEVGYFATEGIAYFILAISVGVTQFFTTKFMQKLQNVAPKPTKKKKNSKKDEPMDPTEMQAQMNKSMTSIFPIMTAFISLSAPAVLGLYWLIQSLMLIAQYFIIDKNKVVSVVNDIVKSKFGKKEK